MSLVRPAAAAYFCSGCAALICHFVWFRELGLVLGRTAGASSTLIASVLVGSAAGALVAGRAADRIQYRRAALIFAGATLVAAAWPLMLQSGIHLAAPLLAWTYGNGESQLPFAATRLVVALGLLAVPAAALGATYPLAVVLSRPEAGDRAASLYAAGGAGAAAGALVAGFWLLPHGGTARAVPVGVALNVLSAAIVLIAALLARQVDGGTPRRRSPLHARAELSEPPAILATALWGAVALSLAIAWLRLGAVVGGGTPYALHAVLLVFAVGSASGALIGVRLSRALHRRMVAFGVTQVIAAIGAVVAARVVSTLTLRVAEHLHASGSLVSRMPAAEVGGAAMILFPLTIALGAGLPLVMAAAAAGASGRRSARLYAAVALGAAAGALASRHLLLPSMGARQAVLSIALVGATSAVLLAIPTTRRFSLRLMLMAGVAAVGAVAVTTPAPNLLLLSSGPLRQVEMSRAADLRTSLEAGRVLFYKDGADSTVTARRAAGITTLVRNGHAEASSGGDLLPQTIAAHLPLLLHPDPRVVLVLGLGTGTVSSAALVHPIERLETVETSAEVVSASAYFNRRNRHVLEDARSRIVAADPRVHLTLTSDTYDVIVSARADPSVLREVFQLTVEFFATARARLKPGGLMCQWVRGERTSATDLRSIVATFAAAFPHASIWLVGERDLLLIGGEAPVDARLEPIARHFSRKGVAADLAGVHVRAPSAILAMNLGSDALVRRFARGAAWHDDHAPLQYSARRSVPDSGEDAGLGALLRDAQQIGPPSAVTAAVGAASAVDWVGRGHMLLRAGAVGQAYEAFQTALHLDPESVPAAFGLVDTGLPLGRAAKVRARLEQLVTQHPSAGAARLGLSRLSAAVDDRGAATRYAQDAIALDDQNPDAWEQLAAVAADAGDASLLGQVVPVLQARFSSRASTSFYSATFDYLRGDYRSAINGALEALRRDPDLARAHNLVGAAQASLGLHDLAERSYAAGIEADPTNVSTFLNAARLELLRGDVRSARARFAEALMVSPTSPEALAGLADLLEREGDGRRAQELRRRILH